MMDVEKNRQLEMAGRIVREGLAGHSARVILFGSWARGEATRTSDIDIAVLGPQPVPTRVMSAIAEKLEDSSLLYRVDLVDLSTATASFRERALAEGIEWTA